MNNLLQYLQFALRQMRRSPSFAITAVLTLALGVAANVIVFGVLQALILDPIDDYPMTVAAITFVVGSLLLRETRHVKIWDAVKKPPVDVAGD